MFFNIKKVLIAVALILGVMTLVIFGFLSASGIFSFDSRDDLYQGVLDKKYTGATSYRGEPLDEETLEILNDSEYFRGMPNPAASGAGAGTGAEADTGAGADAEAEAGAGTDANAAAGADAGTDANTNTENSGNPGSDPVRVLLFLGSGELVAEGSVTEGDTTFSLVKAVDFSELKKASDAPHMNRERNMLTYRDVEDVLENGGFFRVEFGGFYLSPKITPKSPELVQ
jgi:hypothetical protein